MAIYIKGVELPKHGYTIITLHDDGSLYCRKIEKGKTVFANFIKATYITEPHGRLIDESIAYDKIAEQETGYYMDMDGVDRGLQDTPTVIEGSE